MAVSKDDILETISKMTVMEIVDLISAMEEKFGVSAAAAVAVAAGPAAGGAAANPAGRPQQCCRLHSGRPHRRPAAPSRRGIRLRRQTATLPGHQALVLGRG